MIKPGFTFENQIQNHFWTIVESFSSENAKKIKQLIIKEITFF